ncbi:MAG: SPFH domain-containing protein [Beijerinckiaceae bacterium]|jgi:regulator of protease activity HflC (stomatin/prohibitin superfamily)
MAASEIILLILILGVFFSTVRVANEYQRAVVFRLGKYNRTSGPGLYFTIPFLEWRAMTDLRVLTTIVEQQETITRDNVPVKINAVIWRRTVNPRDSIIKVNDADDSVVQVAATALRNIIGQHSLDEVLKSQDVIATALAASIDLVTEPWGVKVERVQMKNVEIPDSIAARPGARSRSPARKASPANQGGSRSGSGNAAAGCRAHYHGRPRRPGAAADANDYRGRRGTKHHDDHHDAERIRGNGARFRARPRP